MSLRRRRADDFTDSLSSFRQTVSDEELSQTTSLVSLTTDGLNSIRNKQDGDGRCSRSKNNKSRSIILAGSLACNQQCISSSDSCNIAEKNYNTAYNDRQFLLKDTLTLSDETSYLSMKPDLNKCINLFHNEYLKKDHDSLEEQSGITVSETTISKDNPCHLNKNKTMGPRNLDNRLRSKSTDSLRNIILLNQELRRSKSHTMLDRFLKRDTNYNIKDDQFTFPARIAMPISHNEKVETIVPSFAALSLSKPAASSSKKDDSHSRKEDQFDSINSTESSRDELNPSELKTFLHSLADQKPVKDAAVQQRLLRRLSTDYYDSPRDFTEGLLTIIEESVINTDSCAPLQYPEVSLCRLSEELKKVCKFIEDETAPEWPQSPGMSTPIHTKRKSHEYIFDLLRKSSGAATTPDKGLCLSAPASSRHNIKSPKKKYWRMSRNTCYSAKNLHDSTNTFESLEAMCKNLYPDDYGTLPAREKNGLQSPLQNMDSIWRVCESQMASLENSPNICKQINKAGTCTSDSTYQHNKTPEAQNLQHRLLLNEKYDRMDSKRLSNKLKQIERDKRQELNTIENTLRCEIAKKRQRCLDTAKIIMESDENLESTEGREMYSNIVINESSPTRNEDKFMETLMCVMKYQQELKQYQPWINLLNQARLSSPRTPRDRKDIRAKKLPSENFNTCALVLLDDKKTLQTPRLSPRKKSTSPSSTKSRSANKTVVSKPRLFVTPGKTAVNKNCKPKRTYFTNFPPGKTNNQNKPNTKPKSIYGQIGSYDHVISPVGMYIKGESYLTKNPQFKRDRVSLTPKRKQTTRSPSPKISKFRLSPKRPKEKLTGRDENIANNFLHPNYKPSSHMKETENRKVENHVN